QRSEFADAWRRQCKTSPHAPSAQSVKWTSAQGENYFPLVLAAFHAGVRLARLGECEHRIDDRTDAPGGEQWPHLLQQLIADRSLELRGAGPQRRPGDHEALLHDSQHVDLTLRSALRRDHDEAALGREHLQIARHVAAADHVENDVDAAPAGRCSDLAYEIFGLVVDR